MNSLSRKIRTPKPVVRLTQLVHVLGHGADQFHIHVKELEIGHAECVVIKGATGCGKSTLVQIVGLAREPMQVGEFGFHALDGVDGTVTVDLAQLYRENRGSEIEALRRRYLGHALQSPELFPALSVVENIEIPLRLNRFADRAQRIDEILGALSNAQDPKEMIQRRYHRPHELSGGQRQRVALGRAMAHRPLLLVADEPTSALDVATAKRAIKFMQSMRERDGTAILMATHDDSLAKDFADRILYMEVGQGNIATIVEEITLRTRPATTTEYVSTPADVNPLSPATN